MSYGVSVVVPTYNGCQKLPGILTSLEAQSFSQFEVIIVVDGSTDDSVPYLKAYVPQNFKLIVVEQVNRGRASVRNNGAARASGKLLIFYDDDMRPNPDSIERHVSFHNMHSKAICGGNQLENEDEARSDFDRYRCYLRKKWLESYKGITKLDSENIYLTAANFSIQKETFEALGGFKADLRDHEDRDLARRAIAQGYELYFDASNIAWHDDFVSVYRYIERRRQYYQEFLKLGAAQLSRIKRLFYSIIARPIWVKWINEENLLFLPKFIRYRLYSFVIWGLGTYYPNRRL